MIFLDTAKSGESLWISKELQTALSIQLPVVWVRIGQESGRAPLSIIPSGGAHFVYLDLNPATDEISATEIEEIIKQAFRIHHRDYVDRLLDEFSKLKEIARQQGIELVTIDPRRMIFSLTLPRKAARYRERPLTHLLQLFGRSPTKQDVSDFSNCAKEIGYEPHPKHGAHYDSVILLAAIPSQPALRSTMADYIKIRLVIT